MARTRASHTKHQSNPSLWLVRHQHSRLAPIQVCGGVLFVESKSKCMHFVHSVDYFCEFEHCCLFTFPLSTSQFIMHVLQWVHRCCHSSLPQWMKVSNESIHANHRIIWHFSYFLHCFRSSLIQSQMVCSKAGICWNWRKLTRQDRSATWVRRDIHIYWLTDD